MGFQPSVYSYSGAPPEGQDYAGWLANVFTREGRAENKLTRAKKKRARGHEKAAARLEHRAAVLQAKAEGKKKSLTKKSPPGKLWRSKYPWIERPVPVGQTILFTTLGAGAVMKLVEPIAKGYRPPSAFALREMRSTILGGLQALQAAGVSGYADMNLEGLAVRVVKPAKFDETFMALAGNASSIKEASEFIRKEAIKNRVAAPAWYLRGIVMIQPALLSTQARAQVGGIVAAVGGPIGALVGGGIAAQEAAHGALLQKTIKDFTQKAQEALGKRGARQAKQTVEAQIAATQQATYLETASAKAQAEAEGEALARTIRIGSYTVLALAAGGVVVWFARRNSE